MGPSHYSIQVGSADHVGPSSIQVHSADHVGPGDSIQVGTVGHVGHSHCSLQGALQDSGEPMDRE